ncbi:MAG: segregation/condensation protein A [Bifidobacteriales bacterium]|uniref:segregation and condensation protein A n=1 Tax=Bombella sp. ESL0378 TaxID=2676442 RepID=UPI0013CABF22|nr:segregation/condensation protein A [Bifidobacteriales bacterium]MCT6855889.1 segregation/condensation protein A [Bombella apis]MUG04374.1 segregation/condensation protein A [Bombella sp. ESL0378]
MSDALHLVLEGFEGPLDLLLDLARSQKVDLQKISILQLTEQYLDVVERARRGAEALRLEIAADWLVMAAWLAWLKSRLLLPSATQDDEAEDAAGQLHERLIDLEQMHRAAAWLEEQPRLGRDVFARPEPENHTRIEMAPLKGDMPALVLAYLAARRRSGRKRSYSPRVARYWSIQQARSALARLLGRAHVAGWQSLASVLPELTEGGPLSQRAALAGALMAGLEMARGGQVELRQENAFGVIEWRQREESGHE